MKNTKFRVWDIDRGKMCDVHNLAFHDDYIYKAITIEHDLRLYSTFISIEKFVLMQYTEFNDKEDEEIWDKDILDESYTNLMTGKKEIVRYIVEKEKGMWKLKDYKGRQEYDRYLFMRNDQCVKIGNVFQDPELLEV